MAETTTKPRFRFSLTTLVLLVTILSLALVIWRLAPYRQEALRLRNEVGYLSVSDPSKVHAIRVMTTQEGSWRYRVWIPEGRDFLICLGKVSQPTPADNRDFETLHKEGWLACWPIDAGEHRVDVVAERIKEGGSWQKQVRLTVLVDGRRLFGHRVDTGESPYAYTSGILQTDIWRGVGFDVEATLPAEPLTLLNYEDNNYSPAEPLQIWIAPD